MPIDPDGKKNESTVFTFTSTPTPASPKTVTKKKASKKTENTSIDKPLLSSPELKNKKHTQGTSGVTNSPKKAAKSKSKPKATASPVKAKNVSPKKTPAKPSPKNKQKSQDTSKMSTAATPKNASPASKKKSKPVEKVETPFSPPLPLPVLPIKEDPDARIIAQPMPKLIIKPLKQEKNQLSEYSVSEIPLEAATSSPEKKKGVKRKATTEYDSFGDNEPKPKKKKKKKVPSGTIDGTALESQTPGGFSALLEPGLPVGFPTASISSTQMLSDAHGAKKVGDTIKKKKKKHKEKDRDKTKQKKVRKVN